MTGLTLVLRYFVRRTVPPTGVLENLRGLILGARSPRLLSYVLFVSMALLVPLLGQPLTPHPGPALKKIYPSRINRNASSANAGVVNTSLSPQSRTPGNGISYHGGPLMLGTPSVYYIWYGNWAADPTAVSILSHFAQFNGGSPYYNINTTYYDGNRTNISNSINFGASYTDNYSRGKVLGDADILSIVSSAITGGHLPSDPNGIYFVLTWEDVQETSGFISQYCGWHSDGTIGGMDIKYSFVGNANTQGLSSCAAQTSSSPNGDPAADAMASIIAHELEESTSDPDLNAWYDDSGYENADKCVWTFGTTYLAVNGSLANMNLGGLDYMIQQNWVNASGGYCALSLQAVPALTSLSPNSGAANSSVAVAIAGTNLSGGTINISGTGITASNVTSSATQITATFVIASNAAAGPRNVTVTTTGGTSNTATFTINSSAPSLTVSVNPNSGTGLTQTFSAVYTDPAGSGDLSQVNLLFNTSANGANACWVYYVPASNAIYLISDSGAGQVAGSIDVSRGRVTLSNSQCTVSSQGPVTTSGNNLTVPFGITFAPGFSGQKNLYGYAQSNGGATSGWQLLGTWTPSASTLTITTTALPGGTVNTSYSATVSATGGTAPYTWSATGLPAGLTINPTGQITGSPTTAGISTVMITLTDSSSPALVAKASLQITIAPGFSLPSPVSVNPNTGAGQAQTFSAVYTDPAGFGDFSHVDLLFNTSTNGANACWVYYVPASNAIYLISDSGAGQVPGSINVSRGRATLSNSQCTVSSQGPVTTSGNNLTVPFGITFAPGFTGHKSLYGYAQSSGGATSGWQLLGTWTTGP